MGYHQSQDRSDKVFAWVFGGFILACGVIYFLIGKALLVVVEIWRSL